MSFVDFLMHFFSFFFFLRIAKVTWDHTISRLLLNKLSGKPSGPRYLLGFIFFRTIKISSSVGIAHILKLSPSVTQDGMSTKRVSWRDWSIGSSVNRVWIQLDRISLISDILWIIFWLFLTHSVLLHFLLLGVLYKRI